MAYILCERHGGSGAAAVCDHVAASLFSTSPHPLDSASLVPVLTTYADQTLGPTWLCPDCAALHRVPPDGLILEGEEGLDRFFDTIGFTPVCPSCLTDKYPDLTRRVADPRRRTSACS